MSVTSGFFNSVNGDRRYDAEQMSAIFNGIITDGVFMNVGMRFEVYKDPTVQNTVRVGTGRAWFKGIWINNDAIIPLKLDDSELLLDRYDAIVLEVDKSETVRAASIKVVKGTPKSSGEATVPQMYTDWEYVHQYLLGYIYRPAGSTDINESDISYEVGKSGCPLVTGILQTMTIDAIVAQWEAQYARWYSDMTTKGLGDMSELLGKNQLDFNTWFNNLQVVLNNDVAANLASQVLELQQRFDIFTNEHRIYQTIEDSDGNTVDDSYATTVNGTIKYRIV